MQQETPTIPSSATVDVKLREGQAIDALTKALLNLTESELDDYFQRVLPQVMNQALVALAQRLVTYLTSQRKRESTKACTLLRHVAPRVIPMLLVEMLKSRSRRLRRALLAIVSELPPCDRDLDYFAIFTAVDFLGRKSQ